MSKIIEQLNKHAVITVTAEPDDDFEPGEYAARYGCAPGFADAVHAVQDKAEGNWGWCTVKVTASFAGITSEPEYLGACSYESEEDFRTNSGYFEDMKATCIDKLAAQLESTVNKVAPWME